MQKDGKSRGILGSMARGVFYPMYRVGEQLSESKNNISELRKKLAEAQAEKRAEEKAAFEKLRAEGVAIDSDQERFEALYQANGWTEERLAEQLRTVILTKRFALFGSGAGLLMAFLAILFQDSRFIAFLLCMVAASICAIGFARTLQYGLQQAQIEQRSLMRWRDYVSREDLFRHLFS
jgi:hypothetical protein